MLFNQETQAQLIKTELGVVLSVLETPIGLISTCQHTQRDYGLS